MLCPIRILNSTNFTLGTSDTVELDPRERSWNARISCSQYVFVKVIPADTPRCAGITFSAPLTDGDTIMIGNQQDGIEFVFGDGTGGTVDKGADEIEAADNLAVALAQFAADSGLDIEITGSGSGTVSLRTRDSFMDVEEGVDDGDVIEVTQFISDAAHRASDVEMPTNEFEDVVVEVGFGEILSLIASEPDTEVSVAEVILSS